MTDVTDFAGTPEVADATNVARTPGVASLTEVVDMVRVAGPPDVAGPTDVVGAPGGGVDADAVGVAGSAGVAGAVVAGAVVAGALVFTALPEGLDDMPPGPELGAVLASVDRSRLNGFQLVVVLQARNRQLAWTQAQLLSDAYELAQTPPGGPLSLPARRAGVGRDRHVVEEVSFALSWTMPAAEEHLCLAWCALVDQPAVHAALSAGRIDLPKAKVILREVDLMSREQAAAIIDTVLAEAEFKSTGRLRQQIRRLILKVDPDLVRRRHAKALEDRDVWLEEFKDGTCSITGRFLRAVLR